MLNMTHKDACFRRVTCENVVIYGVLLLAMCVNPVNMVPKTPDYLHVCPFFSLLFHAYGAPGAYRRNASLYAPRIN